MVIRLGYVAISNCINYTSSSPYTYSEYLDKHNLDKLDSVIKSNLLALEEILKYNVKNNVHFYRMSSKLIPLATKSDVCFDYIDKYLLYYKRIGKIIKDNDMRCDFHPDQFCILNSTKSDVVNNTIETLEYHYRSLEAMDIDKTLVLHIGSSTFGKDNSIKRFVNNFNKLPFYLKKCIVIENDDKVFNVCDVLRLCDLIDTPMVLDYHHYNCNKSDIDIKKIFNSWKGKRPKVHFSSPKNKKNFRSHSDYINSDDFIKFIDFIKDYGYDVDVMLEAKEKDDALFRLVRELKYKTDYRFIDDTSFEV